MKVLAVGAHPDDVELGCGGTLARHVSQGDEVVILVVGTGVTSREGVAAESIETLRNQAQASATVLGVSRLILEDFPDNRLDTVPLLDLVKSVERYVRECSPELVYTHHHGDRNVDHRIVNDAVQTACRPLPGSTVRRLATFEVVSSSEWGEPMRPTSFVELSPPHVQSKARAIAQYTGEIRQRPHPRSWDVILPRMISNGSIVGAMYAEAFAIVRERI
jgi:LmbE family N-acetylglucosaminyl deacetylase